MDKKRKIRKGMFCVGDEVLVSIRNRRGRGVISTAARKSNESHGDSTPDEVVYSVDMENGGRMEAVRESMLVHDGDETRDLREALHNDPTIYSAALEGLGSSGALARVYRRCLLLERMLMSVSERTRTRIVVEGGEGGENA